jgi:hypothetical protein
VDVKFPITLEKAFKKNDKGEWIVYPKSEIKTEDDLDGLAVRTTSGRVFIISERTKKS